MASDDFPKKFDVIVLGTGYLESILAAAFARVGYSVLHIDRNDYYCGDWASFNLQGIQKWVGDQQEQRPDPLQRPTSPPLEEGDTLLECPLYGQTNFNIDMGFLVEPEEAVSIDWEKPEGTSSTTEAKVSDTCTTSPEQSLSQTVDAGGDTAAGDSVNQTLTSAAYTDKCETAGNQDESKTKVGRDEESVVKQCDSADVKSAGDQDVDSRLVSQEGSDSAVEHKMEEICNSVERRKAGGASVQTGTETRGEGPAGADVPKQTEKPKHGDKPWSRTSIEKGWRKFNIDLTPRLLYCRGEMVELLINSDVSKYCEFKTVTRVLTLLDQQLQKVPCSRADVFSSKSVSMIEKRMMMKFLMFCMDYQKHPDQYQDFSKKPFTEFLDSQQLKPNIRHFIQHSIAMATDTMTTLEGLERTQKFLVSLGRYGNTAFLWPLYGSGELPQCFARMCAVFAGIYCLRMTASSLILDDNNRYKGIITTEGHRVESKWLIAENSYLPPKFPSEAAADRVTSRAIFMTNKSIQESDSEQLTLLHLPCPDEPNRPVSVLELGPSSMACPQGLYLVHLSREGLGRERTAREDLQYAVDTLFTTDQAEGMSEAERPRVLWYLYFSRVSHVGVAESSGIHDNVVVVPGPGAELDIDGIVVQAKEIFGKLLPDEEFLPKAPNPEDIIYDDGQATETGQGFQEPETPGDSPEPEGGSKGNTLSTSSGGDSTVTEKRPEDTRTSDVPEESCETVHKENTSVSDSLVDKSENSSS